MRGKNESGVGDSTINSLLNGASHMGTLDSPRRGLGDTADLEVCGSDKGNVSQAGLFG